MDYDGFGCRRSLQPATRPCAFARDPRIPDHAVGRKPLPRRVQQVDGYQSDNQLSAFFARADAVGRPQHLSWSTEKLRAVGAEPWNRQRHAISGVSAGADTS